MTANTNSSTARKPRLWRSTILVASLTLVSRILGFARDMVIAQIFGAGAEVDAFLVAFKIPSFMRRLFAEGAFSQAFVPVLSEYRKQHDHQTVRKFVSHMSGFLALILFIVTVLAMLMAPWVVHVFAPGFKTTDLRFQLSSHMLVITFPYLFFISLAALTAAVLNTYDKFAIPAFTPTLLNIVMIIAALWGAHLFAVPVMALAWGVFFSGLVQLVFQLPFIWRLNLLVFPVPLWRDPAVRRVLKLMVPALFGVSVAQINILIDTIFASWLPIGSVSWLYYSDRLSQFPLGVFGVAIATVILPHLSRKHAEQSQNAFAATLDWGIRCVLFLGIPATLGLYLLSGPILATLFHYGEFKIHDVVMASQSLQAFSLGIPAFMLIKILASGFYARQDIKTPVKIGVIALITNTLLNLILIFPLAHAGLALATSLAAWLNAGCLGYLLIKRNIFFWQSGIKKFLLRILFANLILVITLKSLQPHIQHWLTWPAWYRAAHLVLFLFLAIVSYITALWLSGFKLQELLQNKVE
ncbi:MAG: murein biosynthesis integral membrane protein MurJ [Legionellales bacterium]|nr:murein biosynthesis integral membrane protein MurJ [Legionellales bacterium]